MVFLVFFDFFKPKKSKGFKEIINTHTRGRARFYPMTTLELNRPSALLTARGDAPGVDLIAAAIRIERNWHSEPCPAWCEAMANTAMVILDQLRPIAQSAGLLD